MSNTTLKLFFVKGNHPDFEEIDQDLLVYAYEPSDVPALWRAHYELGDEASPVSVKEVPQAVAPGAVNWQSIT